MVGDNPNGPRAMAGGAAPRELKGREPAPSERFPGAFPDDSLEEVGPGGDEAGDAAGVSGRREHRKYLGRPRASRTKDRDSESCQGEKGTEGRGGGRRGGKTGVVGKPGRAVA